MSALVLVFVFVCRVFGLWFKFMRNGVTRFRVGEAIYIYITDFGFPTKRKEVVAIELFLSNRGHRRTGRS